MFKEIHIRLRPVILLIVVLAMALGSAPIGVTAQANRQAAPPVSSADPVVATQPPAITGLNRSSAINGTGFTVYLPLVVKSLPAPVLNAIDNADGDGYYTVSWNAVVEATSYMLEEDDNSGFASPVVVADHVSSLSWPASGKTPGTYFYRVKATNASFDSVWSNTQSVLVAPPAAPVLNAIANADGDGYYTVSWNAAVRAASYTLEEDDNAGFTSPTTPYAGAGTSWNASGKAVGTYYYRVKASNAIGSSAWSNVQWAIVKPVTGPTPGFWQEGDRWMEFTVSADRQRAENFTLYVAVEGPGCGTFKFTHSTPEVITGNSFEFDTGAFYASGTFASPTSASGETGLNDFFVPGCGYVTGGPWSWNAGWVHSAQVTATGAAWQDLAERADVATPLKAIPVP